METTYAWRSMSIGFTLILKVSEWCLYLKSIHCLYCHWFWLPPFFRLAWEALRYIVSPEVIQAPSFLGIPTVCIGSHAISKEFAHVALYFSSLFVSHRIYWLLEAKRKIIRQNFYLPSLALSSQVLKPSLPI